MTELQMGLIGLGAAAVVGVFGYNKWQEIRQRKIAEAVMKPQHEDVLLAKEAKAAPVAAAVPTERSEPEIRFEAPKTVERMEPVFSDPTPTETGEDMPMAQADAAVVPEPVSVVAAAIKAPAEPLAPAPAASPEPMPEIEAGEVPAELLDPRLEYIVAMELVEPVSSIQILHSQRSALHRLNKPVLWVGYNEKAREWQRLSPDVDLDVRRLRVGLQLVNRLGPVSEGDLVIFANAMQALADELMAVADMPPSRVLDQAAEIDRFCAAVDLEIGLNLVSRSSAFPGTKI
ncbi:MAG TPA: cell division protein FtsZ, partial [Azonexus sp.]|nr:cell division protein FtsZ [Azonexus sp.]